MRMGQGERTGVGHGGITCVLQTQFSSFFFFFFLFSTEKWVLGSIPGLATYFRFSFRFFKKGSCQLLVKVCARSTG